jgi:hypothetical protein
MLERLVNNSIGYAMLNKQRRMISALESFLASTWRRFTRIFKIINLFSHEFSGFVIEIEIHRTWLGPYTRSEPAVNAPVHPQ